jgi:DNA repair protein RecO (recombination protein O)
MQLQSSEAIILDVLDLHDYDRIVTFLTRSHGKKRGAARGARRKYSRFAGQLQPLAKVHVTWLEKEQSELVRVSSVELERAPSGLHSDLEGILLGSYLADHMLEFAQENEANDHHFRLLDSTVEALLAEVDRGLAARYYEAWVLRIAGVFPAPHECPACGRGLEGREVGLAERGEGLVCRDCGGGSWRALGRETIAFLLRIGDENLMKLQQRSPTTATLDEVEAVCAQVRRSFLQRELKSYRIIRETLAGIQQ